MMSKDRRCGIFCMTHWEKSRSLVWLLEMESVREIRQSLMVVRHFLKNLLAKEAELMGWPGRKKPWVSSTGIGCTVLSVGWNVVEKVALMEVIDCRKFGLDEEFSGMGDEQLQEVWISVLFGLL